MPISTEKAKKLAKSYALRSLDGVGLGRWDEEYYLVGLYHPLRAMKRNRDGYFENFFNESNISNNLDLYIHVPFCHVNCSFCHFYKEINPRNDNVEIENLYTQSLIAEIRLYQKIFGEKKLHVNSIQFGGDTPSPLSVRSLGILLDGLASSLDLSEIQEIKFEFHPDMAADMIGYRQRLEILKAFGLTTAIIDMEATDASVLKSISRGNTSFAGHRELVECAKLEGIQSVATALMTGLPNETLETFGKTLDSMAAIEALDAINLYALMFKPSDAVFQQRRRTPSQFCSPAEKDVMMILANLKLEAAGFIENPSHFFRKRTHLPRQQLSKAKSATLLGLGPASFGYVSGSPTSMQYMNFPSLARYANAVKCGNIRVWRGSFLNEAQQSLRRLLFALNSFEWIPTRIWEVANIALHIGELDRLRDAFISLDLVECGEFGYRLTKKGRLRNAEIIFFLSEKNAVRWDIDDCEFELLRRYEFFPNVSPDNQFLFSRFLNEFGGNSGRAQ